MKTYTGFCQEADGTGTIWIGPVEAESVNNAIHAARVACGKDWNYGPGEDCFGTLDDIHVLGIAEGTVSMLFWEDVCDTGI